MSKASSTIIAALAALTISGGAFAQAAGGAGNGSNGSTAGPANQAAQSDNTNSGYGTPGMTNSGSGAGLRAPNSGLPSGTNNDTKTSAPKSNNTLARPSVVSPAANQ